MRRDQRITATRACRGADRRTLTPACQCPNCRTGGSTNNPGAGRCSSLSLHHAGTASDRDRAYD